MPLILESVRSVTVPRELALRLAVGRAVEVLAIYQATGDMLEGGESALKRAAGQLRLDPVSRDTMRSIGENVDQIELLVVATEALGSGVPKQAINRLAKTVDDLEQVAGRADVTPDVISELLETLRSLRGAIAISRAQVPDEIISETD